MIYNIHFKPAPWTAADARPADPLRQIAGSALNIVGVGAEIEGWPVWRFAEFDREDPHPNLAVTGMVGGDHHLRRDRLRVG